MEKNIIRNNNGFGKIIFSQNSYQNLPQNLQLIKNNNLNSFNFKKETQKYDNIIKKAKKTIEDYRKELNEENFSNNTFYENQKRNQLNKFNSGQSEYRYYSPSITQNDFSQSRENSNNGLNTDNINYKLLKN